MLALDVVCRAEKGDPERAIESTRAIVNAGRATGEDGQVVPLARNAAMQIAAWVIKRLLAQGQPSEEALTALHPLLEDELRQPWLTRLFRFQRAEFQQAAERVEPGKSRWRTLYRGYGADPSVGLDQGCSFGHMLSCFATTCGL